MLRYGFVGGCARLTCALVLGALLSGTFMMLLHLGSVVSKVLTPHTRRASGLESLGYKMYLANRDPEALRQEEVRFIARPHSRRDATRARRVCRLECAAACAIGSRRSSRMHICH